MITSSIQGPLRAAGGAGSVQHQQQQQQHDRNAGGPQQTRSPMSSSPSIKASTAQHGLLQPTANGALVADDNIRISSSPPMQLPSQQPTHKSVAYTVPANHVHPSAFKLLGHSGDATSPPSGSSQGHM
eukprot:Selendium_serpulae@DN4255_c0_g2_i3.p2